MLALFPPVQPAAQTLRAVAELAWHDGLRTGLGAGLLAGLILGAVLGYLLGRDRHR